MQLVNGHEMQIGGWTSKSFCQRKGMGVEKGSREGRAKKLLRGGEIRPRTRERWGERGNWGHPGEMLRKGPNGRYFIKLFPMWRMTSFIFFPVWFCISFLIYSLKIITVQFQLFICAAPEIIPHPSGPAPAPWELPQTASTSAAPVPPRGGQPRNSYFPPTSSQNNRQRAPFKCLAPLLLLLLHSRCSGPHSLFPPPFLSVPCLSCF